MHRPPLLASESAFAHGFAGPHMFVSTLITHDPNVADEASLPNHGNTQYLIAPGNLRDHRRGADPRQQGDRLVPGRDRAVPFVFRRFGPDEPRQACCELVELMCPVHLFALAMLSIASPAFAHAFLERASPPVGSEIATSLPQLSITFTEGIEPLFSTIELRDANGATVSTGKPRVAPDNNRRMTIDLPKLPPGTYSVILDVTSVDTHKTEGSYQFTISR